MLLWLQNLDFAGGDLLTPAPQLGSGGHSPGDEGGQGAYKNLREDDLEILSIIRAFLSKQI